MYFQSLHIVGAIVGFMFKHPERVVLYRECGHSEHIFGAEGGERIAREYGVPLLGSLPLSLAIREHTDGGCPSVVADPGSAESLVYREVAERVAAALAGSGPRSGPEIVISND